VPVAQPVLVGRRTENPRVGGSIPPLAIGKPRQTGFRVCVRWPHVLATGTNCTESAGKIAHCLGLASE